MKIAIFYCEEIPRLFLLEAAAKRAGLNPHLFHLKDVELLVECGNGDLRANEVTIGDFDLAFVMGFWNYQFEVSLIADFCRFKKIPLFDSALLKNQTISKMADLFKFMAGGLPVPKTLFPQHTSEASVLYNNVAVRPQHSVGISGIIAELEFPMVVKEHRSRLGNDVYLLKNKKELEDFTRKIKFAEKTLATPLYKFQEFIPADFDIRVIVVGGEIVGAIERRSAKPEEFRHNLSLGGHAKQIEISDELKKMAIRAAEILNYEFAGVDLITHKETGKTYMLEVNRSPGFEGFMQATGIDVPAKLMEFFCSFAVRRAFSSCVF